MNRLEPFIYILVLSALGVGLVAEGAKSVRLQEHISVTPKDVYKMLSNSQLKMQIIDARAYDDDHYLDSHIPGSVPLPHCSDADAPKGAAERAFSYVTTVVISDDGDAETFVRCSQRFKIARNLKGGMNAWSDANLPFDVGDYSPPKNSAGGGCL